MCGIFGAITKDNYMIEQILQRLEMLEYRGYDSAGLSILENNDFVIKKSVGYINKLYSTIKNKQVSNVICHTRWATHGKINKANTHPHRFEDVCIVHNGIIDNYKELINTYQINNQLKSECDSEIISYLINRQFKKYDASIENLIDAISLLQGSFSLLIQHRLNNELIFGAKLKSPLYVGKTKNGFIFSSDLIAFQGLVSYYYELDDNEFFVANKNGEIKFYNSFKMEIEKPKIEFENLEYFNSKGNFSSFLAKEINEIPQVLCNTYFHYTNSFFKLPNLKDYKEIHCIACGTAYHSACLGKYILESNLKIHCTCHIASEFLFEECLNTKNSIFIFISQSGETYDTIQCALKIKNMNLPTLAITNTIHSQLSRICDYTLPIYAGKEISVASTKVFNCTILAFYFLANKKNIKVDSKIISELTQRNSEKELALEMCKSSTTIFIGKCEDNVLAMESVLKYRELTYRNTLSYPCGELKHGTLSIIDQKTLTIAILTNEKYLNSIFATLNEIRSRKGKTALITSLNVPSDIADFIIQIPKSKVSPINLYSIIPMQKLALFCCEILNLDPDKPRNLAKSVTVH